MQCDGGCLDLDAQTRMLLRHGLGERDHAAQVRWRQAQAPAVDLALVGAVLGGQGQLQRGQQRVQLAQAPARHNGQRPVQALGKALQKRHQIGGHFDRIRLRRQLGQRSVKVQEQGGLTRIELG